MAAFDTRSYCLKNGIISFSCGLKYDGDTKKKIPMIKGSWKKITADNFMEHHDYNKTGFGILMGANNMIVIDCDIDKSGGTFPQEILDLLDAHCKSVVKTPNGKHYYFNCRKPLKKQTNAYWNGARVEYLDVIAADAFIFAPPTNYTKGDTIVAYQWLVGDLSTLCDLPDAIYQAIKPAPNKSEELIKRSASIDCLRRLLNGLALKRFSDYNSWINIGLILFNDGIEGGLDLWDEVSQRTPEKYTAGACAQKWATFSKLDTSKTDDKPITVSMLYAWLKADNPLLFEELRTNSHGLESLLFDASHRSLAEVFYSQNSDSYIYAPNANTGWYILQKNNVWAYHGKSIDAFKKVFYQAVAPLIEDLIMKYQIALEDATDKSIADKIKDLKKILQTLGSAPFLQNVASWLQDLYTVRDIHLKMDANIMLFAFDDAVYDFTTGEYRAIAPRDYISTTCGYAKPHYDDCHAGLDVVKRFLYSCFEDADTQDYIMKTLAYSICGATHLQEFYLWQGGGGNGKGLLINLLERALGNYMRPLPIAYFVKGSENKGAALPELAFCKSARVVYATEPDSSAKEKLQSSIIKGLTGNDTISVRTLNKEPFTYKPQFTIILLCNACRFNKIDVAIERRLRLVNFPFQFAGDDKYDDSIEYHRRADHSLNAELGRDDVRGAFILYLLEFYRIHIMGGQQILQPASVKASTKEYMNESNPVAAWLDGAYTVGGSGGVKMTPTEFVGKYNTAHPLASLTAKQFGEYMSLLGHTTKKSNGSIYYSGFVEKNTIQ